MITVYRDGSPLQFNGFRDYFCAAKQGDEIYDDVDYLRFLEPLVVEAVLKTQIRLRIPNGLKANFTDRGSRVGSNKWYLHPTTKEECANKRLDVRARNIRAGVFAPSFIKEQKEKNRKITTEITFELVSAINAILDKHYPQEATNGESSPTKLAL
ncbi:hypothetical protein HHS34_005370 [Acidithiobacillus montserratensis]|uniref:Uncharacterized protein n=1 Tax=Acidithiobacillus montserratensis TaxID=2729135 RepID=A0ACD5HI15_9PROT|nr:hypothetical protein [Acidithiobacillus montserratensis]MBU2746597.1 hypothetical protein [Acidithiobacillus montserratensis]